MNSRNCLISSMLLGAALVLAGCDGQRTFDPVIVDFNAPPTAQIVFPGRDVFTDGATVTVRGTAADDSAVSDVTVNGVTATSADNFASWSATVTLEQGTNLISVDVTDDAGLSVSAADTVAVTQRVEYSLPTGAKINADATALYFVDPRALFIGRLDIASGDIAKVVDFDFFGGPGQVPPLELALDLANDLIYLGVREGSPAGPATIGVWAYDLQAETWSAVSDNVIDSNAVIVNPTDVVLDAANNRLLVADYSIDAIVAVSLATGAQTILASNTVPNADVPFINEPMDIVINYDSNQVMLLDRATDMVLAADLTTGAKSLITGQGAGFGDALAYPLAMTLDAGNNQLLVMDSNGGSLISVDLATGERETVSNNADNADGSWEVIQDARNLAMLDTNVALTFDGPLGHALSIDVTTGEREIITNQGFPRGSISRSLSRLFGAGGQLYASTGSAILRVNDDASVTELAGPNVDPAAQLATSRTAINAAGTLAYVLEASESSSVPARVRTVNLANGSATVLSDATVPNADTPMLQAVDLVLDAANSRLLVVTLSAVIAVDLSTGARTEVSTDTTYTFNSVRDVALDVAGNRLLVADATFDHLIAVDLETGARTAFANSAVSGESGPLAMHLVTVADDDGIWAADIDGRLLRIDADTGDRSLVGGGTSDIDSWNDLGSADGGIVAITDGYWVLVDPLTGDVYGAYVITASSSNSG